MHGLVAKLNQVPMPEEEEVFKMTHTDEKSYGMRGSLKATQTHLQGESQPKGSLVAEPVSTYLNNGLSKGHQTVDELSASKDGTVVEVAGNKDIADGSTVKEKGPHLNTRHSSRLQEKGGCKPLKKKTTPTEGTNHGSVSVHSSPLDNLASVCGFSLGEEEATRLANISLIQAKEEAVQALLNTKLKLSLASEKVDQLDVRVLNVAESSSKNELPSLELSTDCVVLEDNLFLSDKG